MRFSLEDIFVYFLLIPALLLKFFFGMDYAVYVIVPAFFFCKISLIDHKNGTDLNISIWDLFPIIIYFIVVFLSSIFRISDLNYEIAIRDVIVISSSIIFLSVKTNFRHYHIQSLFVAFVLFYLHYINFSISLQTIASFLFADEYNTNEFILGFFFGLFVIYFLLQKDWLFLLLAIVFSLLSSKRVVYLSLFIALASQFLVFPAYRKAFPRDTNSVLYWTVLYIVLASVAIYLEEIITLALEIAGLSSETTIYSITGGRNILITTLTEKINGLNLWQQLFGSGPGQADKYLQNQLHPYFYNTRNPASPHNEYVKLFFDYGLIGLLSFGYIFYKMYIKNKKMINLGVYALAVFIVDNALMVIYFHLIVGMMRNLKRT